MKAKEYAEIWEDFFIANERNDENYRRILFDILIKFADECKDVAIKRSNGNTTVVRSSVLFPTLNEFSDKWKAFAKLTDDGIKEDGFKAWLCNQDKEIADAWDKYNNKLKFSGIYNYRKWGQ